MKAFLVTLFLFTGIIAKSQLYATIDPAFLRVGALYNYKMDEIGFYGRGLYGNIKGDLFYTESVKIGTGISIPEGNANFYFGLNYNHFFNGSGYNYENVINKVSILSVDIGISVTYNRFSMLMMADFINWESILGFSYRFF